ncbi:MAG: PilZ domain-containing protein [Bryobacterales bacterium]|nr:PilZ domain-containing protein [Bryobacterales bacterium]
MSSATRSPAAGRWSEAAPGFGYTPDPERRKGVRFASGGTVPVTILDLDNCSAFEVELVDISRQGLGLVMNQPLPVGTQIVVEIGATDVFGVILRNRRLPNGRYRAGVAIDLAVGSSNAGVAAG